MKNTINTVVKAILVVVLFTSFAFADGDMGNGGKTCTGSNCPNSGNLAAVNPANTETVSGISTFDEMTTVTAKFVEELLTQAGLV